jgi:hypothetical protein
MSASIAATFYNVGYAQTVAQSMEQNKIDVLVLTPNQYMSILQDKAKNNPHLEYSLRKILGNSTFGQYWTKTFSPNAGEPWVGPVAQGANDAAMITKTLNTIGMAGITSYVKSTASGTYIIIKGYSANRSSALQGTRYLATHPQMLRFGLGMKSLQGVAKGGFILGVVVSSGIEVADFIFNDEKTMYDLVGGIGVEAVKGGLAGLLAYGVAAAVGTFVTTVAIAPLIVMAVVAVAAGIALNAVDSELKIKSQVIDALKALPDQTTQGLYYINTKSQSWQEEIKEAVQQKKVEIGRAIDQGVRDWLCRINCRRY